MRVGNITFRAPAVPTPPGEIGPTERRIRELIKFLSYPRGDVRVQTGELALEIARAIDHHDPTPSGDYRSPSWLLGYVLEDLASFPNDPASKLTEIRLRTARRWWSATRTTNPQGDPNDQ